VLDERIQARSREAPSASTVAGPKQSPVLEEAASSIEAFAAEASAVEASARAASFWAEAPLVLQVAAVAPSPAEPAPAEVPAFEEQQQHQHQQQPHQQQQQQQPHHQKPQQQQQQPQQQEQQQQQEQHYQQEQQPQATSLAQRRQGRGSGRGLRSSSNEVSAGATRRQVPSGLILRDSAGRRRFAPQRPSVLQGGRLRASEETRWVPLCSEAFGSVDGAKLLPKCPHENRDRPEKACCSVVCLDCGEDLFYDGWRLEFVSTSAAVLPGGEVEKMAQRDMALQHQARTHNVSQGAVQHGASSR
ncbi:unnamed protein product, partial [Polarella glacialis]